MCGFCMEAAMLQSMYQGIEMDYAEWDIQENPSLLAVLQRASTDNHGYSFLSLLLRILTERLLRPLTEQEFELTNAVFDKTKQTQIQTYLGKLDCRYPELKQILKNWFTAEPVAVSPSALQESNDLVQLLQARYFHQVQTSANDDCGMGDYCESDDKLQQFYGLWPLFYIATQILIHKAPSTSSLKALAFCQSEVRPTFYAEILWLQRSISRFVFLKGNDSSLLTQALPYLRYEQLFDLMLQSDQQNLQHLTTIWRSTPAIKQQFTTEQHAAFETAIDSLLHRANPI